MNGFEVYQGREGVSEWRCKRCGNILSSFFDTHCCVCGGHFGTWCPVGNLMVAEEVMI